MDVQGSLSTPYYHSVEFTSCNHLADEILLNILSMLPFQDLIAASRVNRQFRRICNDGHLLRRDAALVRLALSQLGMKAAADASSDNHCTLEHLSVRIGQLFHLLEKAGLAELASFGSDLSLTGNSSIEPLLKKKMVQEHGKRIRQIQSCFAKGFFEVGDQMTKSMSAYSLECFFEAMESKVGVKHLLINVSLPASVKALFFAHLRENVYHFETLILQGERGGAWFTEDVAAAIAENTNIKKLKFQYLMFGVNEFYLLANALAENDTMEHLEINQFHLEDTSIISLAQVLERSCMKSLSLGHASNQEIEQIAQAAMGSSLQRLEFKKSFVGKSARYCQKLCFGH